MVVVKYSSMLMSVMVTYGVIIKNRISKNVAWVLAGLDFSGTTMIYRLPNH